MADFYRTPWAADFPDVVIHTTVEDREHHPAYSAAKSGDAEAAAILVKEILSEEAIANLATLVGRRSPVLAAVSAIETTGFNAIPDAMATKIAQNLGYSLDTGELRQTNKVAHTKARGFRRFAAQAEFGGVVTKGQEYILIDDHVGLGGTFANMKGYIEVNGGRVIAMTTLTETRDARKIALAENTLNMLRLKHEQELEILWNETFGHGLDCLTNVEAGYLARQKSVDHIRGCLVEAAEEARRAGLSAIAIPGPGLTK